MSSIKLINASCADQNVDAVVNAANRRLWAGGGICGVIFRKAGQGLAAECSKHQTPLSDGEWLSQYIVPVNQFRYIWW